MIQNSLGPQTLTEPDKTQGNNHQQQPATTAEVAVFASVHETNPRRRAPVLDIETCVALAATGLLGIALVLVTLNAGPLWRDEANSINVAQMASFEEFWHNLQFESFPALWLLLLRFWSSLGLAATDLGIRCLGLLVSLCFLGSLWLCNKWVRGRSPIVSLALLGCLPAFVNIVGANRAYGLAMCFLLLSFGAIWRVVEAPTRSRIILAGLVSVCFLQCVYYDAIFLCAMLFGAALVTARRRAWGTLAALVGIGLVAGTSLIIYLPGLRSSSPYVRMAQVPFPLSVLWFKLSQAVTLRSSAQAAGRPGREVWLWIFLFLCGLAVAVVFLISGRRARPVRTMTANLQNSADLALFACTTILCGTCGYLGFLLRIRFPTQAWYYVAMLCLCAVSLDVLLGAVLPGLRPWGWARIGLLAIMTVRGAGAVGDEAHARRTNIDRIAAVLQDKADEGDLIVVGSAWEGITFDRYYHGRTTWATLPPINSHKVHRVDLVWAKMNQSDAIAPVLDQITDTVQRGKHVWVAGPVQMIADPKQLPLAPRTPPGPDNACVVPYLNFWGAQVTAHLSANHREGTIVPVQVDAPVNWLEDLPLQRF